MGFRKFSLIAGAALIAALAMPAMAADEAWTSVSASALVDQVKSATHRAVDRAVDHATEVGAFALNMLGIDYKFGGNTPERGFDCSGLVRYVFQNAMGLALPHNAAEQSRVGRSVKMDELRPGDLVFFNTRRFAFSHVGIYLGDNKMIHAPATGKPVQVVDMGIPYWQNAFDGARRLIESAPMAIMGAPLKHEPPTMVALSPTTRVERLNPAAIIGSNDAAQ
jgi:cell wall-associated NlpC family hydrolase